MAKSIRSKVKRSFRNKKREDSVYAATEAARLKRLHGKLAAVAAADKEGDIHLEDAEAMENDHEGGTETEVQRREKGAVEASSNEDMDTDEAPTKSTKISTHGPRKSRREEWRRSKGMTTSSQTRAVNRQGLVPGKRKAGRSHRRR